MAKASGGLKEMSPLVQEAHTCACCRQLVSPSDTTINAPCGHVMHVTCYHDLVATVPHQQSDVVVQCSICDAPVVEFQTEGGMMTTDCDTCGHGGEGDGETEGTPPLSDVEVPPAESNIISATFAAGHDLEWLRTKSKKASTLQDLLSLDFKKAHLRDTVHAPLTQLAQFGGVNPDTLHQLFNLTAADFEYLCTDVETLKLLGYNVQEAVEADESEVTSVSAGMAEAAASAPATSASVDADWEQQFRSQIRHGYYNSAQKAMTSLNETTKRTNPLRFEQRPAALSSNNEATDGDDTDIGDGPEVQSVEYVQPYVESFQPYTRDHYGDDEPGSDGDGDGGVGEATTASQRLTISDRILMAQQQRQNTAPAATLLSASSQPSFQPTAASYDLNSHSGVRTAAKELVNQKLRTGDLITRAEAERRVAVASNKTAAGDFKQFLQTAVQHTTFGSASSY